MPALYLSYSTGVLAHSRSTVRVLCSTTYTLSMSKSAFVKTKECRSAEGSTLPHYQFSLSLMVCIVIAVHSAKPLSTALFHQAVILVRVRSSQARSTSSYYRRGAALSPSTICSLFFVKMQSTIEATMQARDRLAEKLQFLHTRSGGTGLFEVEDPGPNGKVVSCHMNRIEYVCVVALRSAEEVAYLLSSP